MNSPSTSSVKKSSGSIDHRDDAGRELENSPDGGPLIPRAPPPSSEPSRNTCNKLLLSEREGRHAYLLGRHPVTHLRGVFLGRSERFSLRAICVSTRRCVTLPFSTEGQHGEKTERGEASRISGAPPGPRSSKADSRCARKAEIAPSGASSRRGRSVASLRPSGPSGTQRHVRTNRARARLVD